MSELIESKEDLGVLAANPEPTPQPVAPTTGTPRFFTEGELLRWKGRWFKLVKCDDNGNIVLAIQKPTDRDIALQSRRERWLKSHPHATHDRQGQRLRLPSHLARSLARASLQARLSA